MKRLFRLVFCVMTIVSAMRADAFLFSTGGGLPPPVGFLVGHNSGNFVGHSTGTLSCHSCSPSFIAVASPSNPTVQCTQAAGSVVSMLSTLHGDGNTVTWSAAGDTTDFTISGANLDVATAGISVGNCGHTVNVTVTATQP